MNTYLEEAKAIFEYTRGLRRDFHRHPEMGFQERRTAGIVARELNQHGYEVTTGLGETGVVGVLDSGQKGPVVLLRFDMDALPIQEETNASYASTVKGVMHACGHDGHVAVGLTVARLLAEHAAELKGTIKLMFQPAEEGLGGAERMIKDGVLTNPQPESALALHLWNERPVGWFGIPGGPLMAGSDIFTVKVKGRGGHGAMPDQTIDPVYAAAQMITALQSIVSRNIPPLEQAVVTVTQMRAGETFNVIPSEAVFKGTIRTFEKHTRRKVLDHFEKIVNGIAQAMDCEVETLLEDLTPAVVNDRAVTQRVLEASSETFKNVKIDLQARTMVSEDMAFVMEKVPGCYFLVGSANPDKGLNYAHHHPKFDFDENVLPIAAALMTAAAVKLVNREQSVGGSEDG
jgi:amidohydrolase